VRSENVDYFQILYFTKYTQNVANLKPSSGGQSVTSDNPEGADAMEEANPPETSNPANTPSQK